jgi:hypothetical protein
MPVVIAKWPNGTFSIIRAPVGFSMTSLFWAIDTEACPTDAQLYLLKSDGDGWAHMTFDWGHNYELLPEDENVEAEFVKIKLKSIELGTHEGKLRKLKWPKGIVRQAYRTAFGDKSSTQRSKDVSRLSADELKDFPAEPSRTFSVDEIRAMPTFCGVYFAYNHDGSCHYVGESKTVPTRVSKGRAEIGDRRIGVIRCAPHERRRIEAFFVAVLDPPGNAISTHRMLAGEQSAEGEVA